MIIFFQLRLQVDLYLLPQAAFPTGGLYFKNKTWVKETKGMHAIIHNNYIVGFEKKIKRFRDYGLWLVDDHAHESPLGGLWCNPCHMAQVYHQLWSKHLDSEQIFCQNFSSCLLVDVFWRCCNCCCQHTALGEWRAGEEKRNLLFSILWRGKVLTRYKWVHFILDPQRRKG